MGWKRGKAIEELTAQLDLQTRILLVDGLCEWVDGLAAVLGELGFANVDRSSDGKDALKQAKNGKLGLLVSDWELPISSGIELLKSVRSDTATQDLPFLMVATAKNQEHFVEAICAGATNILLLPAQPPEVLAKLEVVFKVDPFRVD